MAIDTRELLVGVVVAAVDVGIYRHFVPSVSDIRTADAFNGDIEHAERTGLIVGSVFTLVVAGLAQSMKVFAVGGITLVALDFAIKHANAIDPSTGKMAGTIDSQESTTYPMPDYGA